MAIPALRLQEASEKTYIVQSMPRKGSCLDNAMEENFFGIMKSELLYAENFEWSKPLKAWDNYIEYYNNKRIKARSNTVS